MVVNTVLKLNMNIAPTYVKLTLFIIINVNVELRIS